MAGYSNNTILITGVNGFIGKHLCDYLVDELHVSKIYGVDKFYSEKPANPGCQFRRADIENLPEMNQVISEVKPRIIFHLAADIKPSRDINDLPAMLQTNLMGTVNLLSAVYSNQTKLSCFINMGTGEEYGNNRQPFTEDLLPNPVSIYSGTKAAAAALCKMFYNLYHIPIITVRPSLVYGPGQSVRFFIIEAIHKLLLNEDFDMTGGEQTRDYLYIDDLVAALIELSQSGKMLGEEVNVSTGVEHQLKEVILFLLKATHSKSQINFGALSYRQNEIMRYVCDNTKITSNTNWRPKVSLEEGLAKTIDFIKNGS
jgi:nucleoside-diphosphate-sugar epimerase